MNPRLVKLNNEHSWSSKAKNPLMKGDLFGELLNRTFWVTTRYIESCVWNKQRKRVHKNIWHLDPNDEVKTRFSCKDGLQSLVISCNRCWWGWYETQRADATASWWILVTQSCQTLFLATWQWGSGGWLSSGHVKRSQRAIEWSNARTNDWMNQWTNEWMNECMHEWMNEWMNTQGPYSFLPSFQIVGRIIYVELMYVAKAGEWCLSGETGQCSWKMNRWIEME